MHAGEALFGRDGEVALLERLLDQAAAERGGALIIRGEPGIGKTALLGRLARTAERRNMRVLTAAGVESESRLPYAALHQLLFPLSAALDGLPPVHRAALRAAFGLEEAHPGGPGVNPGDPGVNPGPGVNLGSPAVRPGGLEGHAGGLEGHAGGLEGHAGGLEGHAGGPDGHPARPKGHPDLYAVALAALEVIVEAASERPIVLIIDDLHWVDKASGDVLAFVGRRIGSDAVLAVGGTRVVALDDPQRRTDLPYLELGRLDGADAAALLDVHAPQLSPAVRERFLAEAAGNPLALVELPRSAATGAAAGPPNAALPLNSRLEAAFAARAGDLAYARVPFC